MSNPAERVSAIAFGAVAAVLGGLGIAVLSFPSGFLGITGVGRDLALLLGAPLFFLGMVTLLAAVFRFHWRKIVLWTGLILLGVGGFPWIYTPALMHDRFGGEGAGMLGTVIFILVGLPGLVCSLVGGALLLGEWLGKPSSRARGEKQ